MLQKESSHYEIVANSFRVLEIAMPIEVRFDPDGSLENVWEQCMEMVGVENEFILIKDESRIYGYLNIFDDFTSPLEGNAQEKAHLITPDQIVPGTMPLLELPSLFENHYFYFVLTQNDISHVVSFQSLDEIPMKLCIFTLIMELEARMLDLLLRKSREDIEVLLNCLPKPQLKSVRDLYKKKYKDIPEYPEKLLRCTTFTHKKQILGQCPEITDKLAFENKEKMDDFFNRVQEVRNQIAHSDSIIVLLNTPEAFNIFLSDLRKINTVMGQLLLTADRSN